MIAAACAKPLTRSGWITPVRPRSFARTSLRARVFDRVASGVCAIAFALAFVAYGWLAVGLLPTYVAAQSGLVHWLRAVGYRAFEPLVFATCGLALGVSLSVHAALRLTYGDDAYLEHVAGPAVHTSLQRTVSALNHVVVPALSVAHLVIDPPPLTTRDSGAKADAFADASARVRLMYPNTRPSELVTDLLLPAAVAAAEVSVVVFLHELVSESVDRALRGNEVLQLALANVAETVAWTLLAQLAIRTLHRHPLPRRPMSA